MNDRERLIEMIGKIKSDKLIKRLYSLAEYLYIYKDGEDAE